MIDRFLPDYGLYLLSQGIRPETRRVFFDLPVDHLTRPALRTVSLTLSTEEQGQDYAISFDFIGPRIDDQGLYERFAPLIVQRVTVRP